MTVTKEVVRGLRKVRAHIPIPRKRRIHAYGLGNAKTGTTSLYSIFAGHFRAAHEPDKAPLIDMFAREEAGQVNQDEIVAFLRKRDRKLQLEMDSSALNWRYAGLNAELFPRSRFILTLRDPYTRTDSLINHLLNTPREPRARERADVVFRSGRYVHKPEEEPLRELGLHTLDGYLEEYARTARGVLDTVPPEQLLVVRTDRLGKSLGAIADFLGIAEAQLDARKSHRFKAPKRHGVLLRLAPEYVDRKVREHFGDLLDRFFPDIRSIKDLEARLAPD